MMTKDESLKILGLPPKATPRQIDQAFLDLRRQYLCRAQNSPVPEERDLANRALGHLQVAYRTLTGREGPLQTARNAHASGASSDRIPRVSLGGDQGRSSNSRVRPPRPPPLRQRSRQWQFMKLCNEVWPRFHWPWSASPERVAASLIVAGMFFIALLVLACVRG